MEKVIAEVKIAIQKEFKDFTDWAHGIRHANHVGLFARQIAVAENFDPDIAEIAGLLHDLGRLAEKQALSVYPPPDPGTSNHASLSVAATKKLIASISELSNSKDLILDAINQHSDKTLRNPGNFLACILMDADRSDGWGNWGLLRMAKLHGNFPITQPQNDEEIDSKADKLFADILANKYPKDQIANFLRWLKFLVYWWNGNKQTGVQPLNTKSARILFKENYLILKKAVDRLENYLDN